MRSRRNACRREISQTVLGEELRVIGIASHFFRRDRIAVCDDIAGEKIASFPGANGALIPVAPVAAIFRYHFLKRRGGDDAETAIVASIDQDRARILKTVGDGL